MSEISIKSEILRYRVSDRACGFNHISFEERPIYLAKNRGVKEFKMPKLEGEVIFMNSSAL